MGVNSVHIDAQSESQRVDNYLFKCLKGVPKSRIYRALRNGEVRVNSKRVQAKYRLQIGDILRIPPLSQATAPEKFISSDSIAALKDCVIYQDSECLVLNKPADLAVHAGSGVATGVIDILRAAKPAQYYELVHRLDKETTGCLIIAKTRQALIALQQDWQKGLVEKHYVALVQGSFPEDHCVVSQPLSRYTVVSGERRANVCADGKPAETHFNRLQVFRGYSLVEAKPITGRTHQIRVHLAWMGLPIVGDDKYTNSSERHYLQELPERKLCLHAAKISFILPGTSHRMTLSATVSSAMQCNIEWLEDRA